MEEHKAFLADVRYRLK
jgi:hypothetical protein